MGNCCYTCCCYCCEKKNKVVLMQQKTEVKKETNVSDELMKATDLSITKQTENETDLFYNNFNTTMNESVIGIGHTNLDLNCSTISNNNDKEKERENENEVIKQVEIVEENTSHILNINYKKVRSMSKLNVKNNVDYIKSSYDSENSRLLVCDVRFHSLSAIDLVYSKFQKLNPKSSLAKPISICLNNQNHVIVFDSKHKKLFIFKSTIIKKRKQELTSSSKQYSFILNDITIDKVTNHLYGCDKDNSRLVTFESDDPKYKRPKFLEYASLLNFSPTFIYISDDKIFVIDSPKNEDSDISSQYSNSSMSGDVGQNSILNHYYIHIIDKNSQLVLKTINHKILFKPIGLFVDKNMNIITTGYCIYKQSNISNTRYLYTISQEGQILNRTNLYFDGELSDINMISDEKIVLVSKNDGIYIYEFDKGLKKRR